MRMGEVYRSAKERQKESGKNSMGEDLNPES
jgi:hypothetical protein